MSPRDGTKWILNFGNLNIFIWNHFYLESELRQHLGIFRNHANNIIIVYVYDSNLHLRVTRIYSTAAGPHIFSGRIDAHSNLYNAGIQI